MSISTKRVALIGYGSMGQNHARVLSSMPETELVGIFDPNFQGKSFIFEKLKQNSIAQLSQMDLDYCVIATPTNTHKDIACLLSKLNVNILIEKPIAIDYTSAQEIIDCADKNKVKAAVGHIERFNAAMIEARKRIQIGQIGKIIQIISSRQGPFPVRVSDVGVITDLATHDIDVVTWLTNASISKISAEIIFKDNNLREDGLFLIGELNSGVKISMTVNWINPIKERKTTIVGELGTFVVDTLNSTLVFYENGIIDLSNESISNFRGVSQGNVHEYAFEKTEALKTEHRGMISYIDGDDNNICSLIEGKKILETVDIILKSNSTGNTIHL